MKISKEFEGKKIKVKNLSTKDLKKAREFQDYINSLIEEEAQILLNKKVGLKEEKKWLKKEIGEVKNGKRVTIVAEHKNKIVGICDVWLKKGRESHVAEIGISVRRDYRGIGLGKFLMKTALKIAKDKLRPSLFRLSVFSTNKIAQNLYKKLGFKEVARIPKQIQYKGKLVDEIVMMRKA
jgi:ribosomal protein S18 acetylase RimI-like enzyme